MKHHPYNSVKMFEESIAEFTGAPYATAVSSCTDALFLCCKYLNVGTVTIPKETYLSVPGAIIHAGGIVIFQNIHWKGIYQLKPYPIYDASKRLRGNMYLPGTFMCLSFQFRKTLNIGKGGVILHDSKKAEEWFKKARYEGRTEQVPYHEDDITMLGWNMYMTPEQAARGLTLLQYVPKDNPDQIEEGGYRDLTEFTVFKNCEVLDE